MNKIQYMSENNYKVGDRVRIKSFDWFKANEYSGQGMYDDVLAFLKMTDECCGKEFTIDFIFTDERGTGYIMKEPNAFQWRFTDSMIEGPVDAEPQEKMVSLEEVCKWIKDNVDDDILVKCGNVIKCMDVNDFVLYFRKAMGE